MNSAPAIPADIVDLLGEPSPANADPAPSAARGRDIYTPGGSVTAAALASLLGLSLRTLNEHAQMGSVVRIAPGVFDFAPSVTGYCEHLRKAVDRRQPGSPSAAAEKARLVREQADSQAMKNAQARGELVPSADVERAWSSILSDVRAALLAVPSRIGARLGSLTPTDLAVIDSELRDALAGLADAG